MGYIEVQFSDYTSCLLHEYYDCDETIKRLVDDLDIKGMQLRLKLCGDAFIEMIKKYFNEDDRIVRIIFKTEEYTVIVKNNNVDYDLDEDEIETIRDMFGEEAV